MEYTIKKVVIGYLKNERKTGIIQNSLTVYKLQREEIDEKICIIVDDNAIDIENFENIYPILKRNKYKQILPNQETNEKTLYALELKELSKENIPLLKSLKYKKNIKQYKKINR